MFKLKFKREHNHSLLISLAFLSMLVVGIFYLFFSIASINRVLNNYSESTKKDYDPGWKSDGDPMITQVPNLENTIDGPTVSATDPSLGSSNAKVNIVQFSDFSCGYCQKQEEIIKQAMQKYSGQIRFIRKDYPENENKSTSYQAALAGRCAQIQGKFWEYRDQIYKNSNNLNPKAITDATNIIKLNKKQLADCLQGEMAKSLIDDNITEANALKITGVPFVYVNKQEIMGEVSLEDLEKMIEKELKNK